MAERWVGCPEHRPDPARFDQPAQATGLPYRVGPLHERRMVGGAADGHHAAQHGEFAGADAGGNFLHRLRLELIDFFVGISIPVGLGRGLLLGRALLLAHTPFTPLRAGESQGHQGGLQSRHAAVRILVPGEKSLGATPGHLRGRGGLPELARARRRQGLHDRA